MSSNGNILEVNNLRTYFNTDDGVVKAVDGVSITLKPGELIGIVGESGSGKSITAMTIMGLLPGGTARIESGEVLFDGKDLLKATEKEMQKVRGGDIAMIFQDPMTSLNPFLRISTQMIETIVLHQNVRRKEAKAIAIKSLEMVGIPDPVKVVDSYPHQFSGGMRQRVMIAMALSCNPKILIADEPTTALDVTIQAQIIDLLKALAADLGTSIIMISHDLGVIAGLCDRICVMYAGKIVEESCAVDLFKSPHHPYTQGLIASVPRVDMDVTERLISIEGQPPNLLHLPKGCAFYDRCSKRMDICQDKLPESKVLKVSEGGDVHRVACWLYDEEGGSHE